MTKKNEKSRELKILPLDYIKLNKYVESKEEHTGGIIKRENIPLLLQQDYIIPQRVNIEQEYIHRIGLEFAKHIDDEIMRQFSVPGIKDAKIVINVAPSTSSLTTSEMARVISDIIQTPKGISTQKVVKLVIDDVKEEKQEKKKVRRVRKLII